MTFAELTLIAPNLCHVRLITKRLIFPLAVDECDNPRETFCAGQLKGYVPLDVSHSFSNTKMTEGDVVIQNLIFWQCPVMI